MKKYTFFFIFLGVIIFAVYEALIWYDTDFRYGRMWETPVVKPHEEPMLVMNEKAVPLHDGEALFRATPAEALKSPLSGADSEVFKSGKVSYLLHCAQCHGKNYDGNATVGQSFFPLPTDLRSAKVQSLSDGAFFKEISYGIPGGRQPPLATTIAPMDRWRIVAYIKSLGERNP